MRIAIDIRMVLKELHGIGRYAILLLKNYNELFKDDEFILLANNRRVCETLDLGANMRIELLKSPPLSLSEQIELPFALNRIKPDVFHAPSIAISPFLITRTVLTIHDLIPFVLSHGKNLKNILYKEVVLKNAARRAHKVITDSRHTRIDVMKVLGVPEDKIEVVYLGVEEVSEKEDGKIEEMRKRLCISRPYFFTLTSPKPYKNTRIVIAGYERFVEKTGMDIPLIIAGLMGEELKRAAGSSVLRGKIRLFEYVSEEDLRLLYQGALAFLYASLYEGFGLPVLEAMAAGTPVITSNAASLPEVVGEAGIYFNPDKPEELAGHMEILAMCERERARLVEEGTKRAKTLTWRECAIKTHRIYEEAAEGIHYSS